MRRVGFSIVEVLVAVAVLAFGLIPVFVLTSGSVRDTGFNQRRVLAHRLLADAVEVYRGQPFGVVRSALSSGSAGEDGFVKLGSGHLRLDLAEARWEKTKDILDKMEYEVKARFEEDYQGEEGLGRLTVRVVWKDDGARERMAEFSRITYDPMVLEGRVRTEG